MSIIILKKKAEPLKGELLVLDVPEPTKTGRLILKKPAPSNSPKGKLVLSKKTPYTPRISQPFLQPGVGIDHAARFVIMSALLYYRFNTQIMSDAQYDELSERIAARWDELNDLRHWQLGSPEEVRTSGYHIKVTYAGITGAASWVKIERKEDLPIYEVLGNPKRWEYSKEHSVTWLTAGG